jgi:Putative DNA-binding domain
MASTTIVANSQALRFFESITKAASPLGALKALVTSTPPTWETEWLEFKGAAQLTATQASATKEDKVKEMWSEALSGFANTQGGVLIWGIDARQDTETGIDAAGGFSFVQSPFSFKTRLLQLHGPATDPPVMGVEIEAFDDPDYPGKGFVVCYIPESSIRPHRAEFRCKQFYIRALDTFRVASVSLLRALFFPLSRAHLIPSFQTAQNAGTALLNLIVSNRGSATASDIVLRIRHDPSHIPQASHCGRWTVGPRLRTPYRVRTEQLLHPGDASQAVQFQFPSSCPLRDIWFTVDVFCRDSEPLSWRVDFATSELISRTCKDSTCVRSLAFEPPSLDPDWVFQDF